MEDLCTECVSNALEILKVGQNKSLSVYNNHHQNYPYIIHRKLGHHHQQQQQQGGPRRPRIDPSQGAAGGRKVAVDQSSHPKGRLNDVVNALVDLLKIWSLTNLSADWCNLYQMVGYVLPFCQKLDWWNRYHPIHHLKILKSTWKDSSLCFNSCWVVPLLGPCWHDDDAMRTGTRTNGIRPQEVSQLRRCGPGTRELKLCQKQLRTTETPTLPKYDSMTYVILQSKG